MKCCCSPKEYVHRKLMPKRPCSTVLSDMASSRLCSTTTAMLQASVRRPYSTSWLSWSYWTLADSALHQCSVAVDLSSSYRLHQSAAGCVALQRLRCYHMDHWMQRILSGRKDGRPCSTSYENSSKSQVFLMAMKASCSALPGWDNPAQDERPCSQMVRLNPAQDINIIVASYLPHALLCKCSNWHTNVSAGLLNKQILNAFCVQVNTLSVLQ